MKIQIYITNKLSCSFSLKPSFYQKRLKMSTNLLKSFIFLIFLICFPVIFSRKSNFQRSVLQRNHQIRPLYQKVSLYFNSFYETLKSSAICQIPGGLIDRLYFGYLTYQAGVCQFVKPDVETYLGPKSGVCGDNVLQSPGTDTFYGDIYQLSKFKQKYPNVKVLFHYRIVTFLCFL